MSQTATPVGKAVDALYRSEYRRIFATLVRLLGDFDVAEEAIQEAFAAALEQWPKSGVPANPRAWFVSAGRFKGIDLLRRRRRLVRGSEAEGLAGPQDDISFDEDIPDDTLRLIFTCCHPALSLEARIALTLREVCGLTTEEIAAAFLLTTPTVAQRIVRAKAKIRDAGIPYRVPTTDDLPDRLDGVLHVIYLVFTEGYAAPGGSRPIHDDLSAEAIRLGRLLHSLIPEPEVAGLLALMLLQESRRLARISPTGDLVILEDQDRDTWNRDLISEGRSLVQAALGSGRFGPYSLQAAIAAVHSDAATAAGTDWLQIVQLYDVLLRMDASPVIELNRAVAVAMRDGPEFGIPLVESLLTREELSEFHLAHAAHAELCRRAGRMADARASYDRALDLVREDHERRYLQTRRSEIAPNQ